MSETSRTILAGTDQVAGALRSAVDTQFRSASLRRQRSKDAMEGFKALGDTLTKFKTWKDAKDSEDEQKLINDAYTLGETTGDSGNTLAAMKALPSPKTFEGATLRRQLADKASANYMDQSKYRLDRAAEFRNQENDMLLERNRQALRDAAAEATRVKSERDRAGDFQQEYDSRVSAIEENRKQTETERHNRAMEQAKAAPDAASGPDQPLPDQTRALLEKKAGLPAGALAGMTFRDWGAIQSDPQADILKQLQIIAAQRRDEDYLPREVGDAKAKLAEAEKDLREFGERAALGGFNALLGADEIEAVRAQKVASVAALKKALDGTMAQRSAAPQGAAPKWDEFE